MLAAAAAAVPTVICDPSFIDNKLINRKPLDRTDKHEGRDNPGRGGWVKGLTWNCSGFERPPEAH